jgi:hypothetical protein
MAGGGVDLACLPLSPVTQRGASPPSAGRVCFQLGFWLVLAEGAELLTQPDSQSLGERNASTLTPFRSQTTLLFGNLAAQHALGELLEAPNYCSVWLAPPGQYCATPSTVTFAPSDAP